MNFLKVTLAGFLSLASVQAFAERCEPTNTVYGGPGEWVLALSYTPNFCAMKGWTTKECARPDTRLDLHGLWPQWAIYCIADPDVKKRASCGDRTLTLNISPDVFAKLKDVMPAVAANLQVHEWYKHGTCAIDHGRPLSIDGYFSEAATLVDAVRASSFAKVIRPGTTVTGKKICDAFAAAYGSNNPLQLEISKDNTMVTGMMINLQEVNGGLAVDKAHMRASQSSNCSDPAVLSGSYKFVP